MRIAHTCAECGFDLTRTAAPIDPVYGLPIVVCPKCQAAVVRREHPTMAWSRWLGRFAASILSIAVRAAGTLLMVGIVVGLSAFVNEMCMDLMSGRRDCPRESLVVGAIGWLAGAIVGGLWIGFCFMHWRGVPLAAVWLLLLLGAALLPGVAMFLDVITTSATSGQWQLARAYAVAVRDLPSGFVLVSAAWMISLGMIGIGRAGGKSWETFRRRANWRRVRAKRKAIWTSQPLLRA